MRQFTTKAQRKPVEIDVVPTEEFLQELVPHKTIHFMSRSGMAEPQAKMPSHMERSLQMAGKAKDPDTRKRLLRTLKKGETSTSKFVMALHHAFANHIPFSFSPEVVMGIISQEVAQYVKKNSDSKAIRSLFTKSADREKLVVEVDDFIYGSSNNDWLRGISVFKNLLTERVPSETLSLMTPKLSQGTIETEVAHLVSFMDAASKYYQYGMMTMCGIPEFRIEGTADDWNTIINSVEKLKVLLPGLEQYFSSLIPILVEIRNTVDGNKIDLSFWSSIYKENDDSGGPFSNGWFNNFYAHIYSQDYRTKNQKVILKTSSDPHHVQLNNYPANLSVVPFEWNYYGKLIPMSFVGGITSVEYTDGFLTPRLGVSVLELEPTTE